MNVNITKYACIAIRVDGIRLFDNDRSYDSSVYVWLYSDDNYARAWFSKRTELGLLAPKHLFV